MPQGGRIHGRVTDAETGEPLIGADVVAMWAGKDGQPRYRTGATNIEGDYVILFDDADHVRSLFLKAAYIGYVSLETMETVSSLHPCNFELAVFGHSD
jgi:hypothetical protein